LEASWTWAFNAAEPAGPGVHRKSIRPIKIKPKPAQACAAAGNHQLFGVTDANGPHNQEVQFPVPPLPWSTMAFDGREAVFAGTYKLKLKGRGKLEAG
jgi:hypothetical protein